MEDGSGISEEEQQLMIMMMMSSSSNSSSKGKQLPFSSSSTSASSFHDQHQPRQQPVPAAASRPTNTLVAAEPLEANEVEEEEEEEEAAGHGVQRESNVVIEKEHMFDKVVTPSDVGKLNRLVIPKQQAEKYFPLDSSTNEKGLLLNFEDRNGKPWRFRYSYWNSSQSYVMTKGWSRFVKDKKLDAGDIVSFQRGVGEFGRDKLFIDWRRRHDAPDPTISSSSSHPHQHHHQYPFSSNFTAFSWNTTSTSSPSILMRPSAPILTRNVNYLYSPNNPSPSRSIAYYNRPVTCSTGGAAGLYGYSGGYSSYNCINSPNNNNNNSAASTVFYMRHAAAVGPQVEQRRRQRHQGLGGGGLVGGKGAVVVEPMVFESVPVVQGKAAAKRLRLFGVNMDCPMATTSNSDSEDNLSLATSTTATSTTTCTNGRMFTVEAPHPPSQQQYPLQLRLHNGTPLLPTSAPHFIRKGKSSSSSTYLDLESSDDT